MVGRPPVRRPPAAGASGRRRGRNCTPPQRPGWLTQRRRSPRACWLLRRDRPGPTAFTVRRASWAASSMRPARSAESTEWMTSKRCAAFLALFDCRWPTKCHVTPRSGAPSNLGSASWILFSPKSLCPARAAALMCSTEKVLEMATRRILAGSRPTRRAALAMRSRTLSSRACSAAGSSTARGYFFSCATSDVAVAAFGPLGASFRYVSNSVAAPARLPSFTSAIPSW